MAPVTIQTTEEDDICRTVIETVAEITGTSPLDLEPLYESIDPDALTSLFGQSHPARSGPRMVFFEMAGCTVVVSSTGTVTVTEGTDHLADIESSNSLPIAPSQTNSTDSPPNQVSD
ncbi:HalOD1 output domain-containing protein [Haladaptatus sp. NG-SE-30]